MCRSPRVYTWCYCHPIGRSPRLYPSPGWKKGGIWFRAWDGMKWKHFPRSGPLWGKPSVTVGLHSQRPVTRSFDGFFTLRLNKQLSKQSIRRWFETPSCSLWRHCNGHGNAFHIIGRLQIIVCDRNPLVTEWLYHKWPRMWTVDTFCVVSRSKLLKNRSSYQLDVRTLNTTWIYQWATIGDTE